MLWETVSDAMPMATSLSQNKGVAGCGWPILVYVGWDFAPLGCNAGGGVQASVFRFSNKEANNRDAGRVAGDGVVDPVVVVGEAEVAQSAADAAGLRAGEEGGV
jgi:hypothetical protein